MKILVWTVTFLAVGFSVWALYKVLLCGVCLFFPEENNHE